MRSFSDVQDFRMKLAGMTPDLLETLDLPQSQAVEDRPTVRLGSRFRYLNLDLHIALSMQATFHSTVVSNDLKLDAVVPTQATTAILNATGHPS